jgi:hypothetical protein
MKFTLPEIPETPLKILGITKDQLKQLPGSTLSALLSGMRTSLLRLTAIRLPGEAVAKTLDARLSLFRRSDQTVGLKIHPINPVAANLFQLSDKEISQLKKGTATFIDKHIVDQQGRSRPVLVSLDPITKSFVATRKDTLRAPSSINGIALSREQQKDWVNGKPITLEGKDYQLDPHAESGIRGEVVSKIAFSHSRVQETDLLIDIGLLASGLGTIILLEHLADLALHSRFLQKSDLLQQEGFRNALAGAARDFPKSNMPEDHPSIAQQLRDKLSKAGFDPGKSPAKENLAQQATDATQQTTPQRSRSPAR